MRFITWKVSKVSKLFSGRQGSITLEAELIKQIKTIRHVNNVLKWLLLNNYNRCQFKNGYDN